MDDKLSKNARLASAVALLATGLLSGAFFYGWANVTPTFAAVPLEVHLSFRTELMKVNGIVMQTLMASSALSLGWFAFAARGRARVAAGVAALLAAASFFVTRFGNVPINGEMKIWAVGGPAPDYRERLEVWDTFNDIRVACAVGAFVLVIAAVELARRPVAGPVPVRGA